MVTTLLDTDSVSVGSGRETICAKALQQDLACSGSWAEACVSNAREEAQRPRVQTAAS